MDLMSSISVVLCKMIREMLFQLEQLDKTFSNTTTVRQFHADSLFKVTVPGQKTINGISSRAHWCE